jgi:hypothetical protein
MCKATFESQWGTGLSRYLGKAGRSVRGLSNQNSLRFASDFRSCQRSADVDWAETTESQPSRGRAPWPDGGQAFLPAGRKRDQGTNWSPRLCFAGQTGLGAGSCPVRLPDIPYTIFVPPRSRRLPRSCHTKEARHSCLARLSNSTTGSSAFVFFLPSSDLGSTELAEVRLPSSIARRFKLATNHSPRATLLSYTIV